MSHETAFRRYITKGHESLQVIDGGDGADELNDQIQRLLEIVLGVYVNTWYSYISPRERTFLPTIHAIILNVLKSIAESLSEEELIETLLAKLPVELTEHVRKLRLAQHEASVTEDGGTESSVIHTFQRLRPHPGMVAVARQASRDVSRQQSDVVLNAAGDLDDTLADAMASSIVVDGQEPANNRSSSLAPTLLEDSARGTLASDVGGQAQEPPFQLDPAYLPSLVDGLLRSHLPEKDYHCDLERTVLNEIIGNAVLGGTLRRVTQPWFWWRIGVNLIGRPAKSVKDPKSRPNAMDLLVKAYTCLSLALNFIAFASIQLYTFVMGDLLHEDSPKIHRRHTARLWLDFAEELLSVNGSQTRCEIFRQLRMLDGIAGSVADEDRKVISQVLSRLIDTLYPGGQPAPVIPDPTPEEAEAMRSKVERALMAAIPVPIRYVLLDATVERQGSALSRILDVIDVPTVNLNLFLGIFDLVVDALPQ